MSLRTHKPEHHFRYGNCQFTIRAKNPHEKIGYVFDPADFEDPNSTLRMYRKKIADPSYTSPITIPSKPKYDEESIIPEDIITPKKPPVKKEPILPEEDALIEVTALPYAQFTFNIIEDDEATKLYLSNAEQNLPTLKSYRIQYYDLESIWPFDIPSPPKKPEQVEKKEPILLEEDALNGL